MGQQNYVYGTWSGKVNRTDMHPALRFGDCAAYTSLKMEAGRDEWNCAAFCENYPETDKPLLNVPQQVTVEMQPVYEFVNEDTLFQHFTELWIEDLNGKQIAELMIIHRAGHSANIPCCSAGEYYESEKSVDGLIYVGYYTPNVPLLTWTTRVYNLNDLLFKKLSEDFDVDLSQCRVYAIGSGVEGYAANGDCLTVWRSVKHEKQVM